MPDDLRAGPDSPPTDELRSAEKSFAVLQHVLHGIAADDLHKQTPCREFDVAGLTDHLLHSITTLGAMAGAQFGERDQDAPIEQQVVFAARAALDAWRRRGLDGTVEFGGNEVPARVMVGILSLEFLVHAWDYAAAVGREVNAPESLSDYVLGLARKIITPDGRVNAGFDDAIDVADDADALTRLLAYTGRRA
ncbi:ArsR family transcriptional regulator [Mycolicibacterium novocastrense]|uniref:TIGR03086 family protein n=1 Tax=Mycolicibacterium novocastrense TaxID=59813 RepID=A0AAW5SPD8_MYCNV|nr:TIGR03086 family metal-binding protein [Mycolicibacterium novocastrense]KUH66139.1 ArsR family transcriptional regulator [Mycolicibacterium novocastrense]KUH66621.1 ArsR family transcriptional regulator [Mycolicibacterium novocastrense]KUH73930.1 ArsR family transcriptional regulator [Mycolicibacterium novocastrense]MCV7026035.1 TIGR03086 family protein [Mycolicibacterium novocastrense]GAT08808.1 TIGR03086 family protein [Mycolicibacterium novocastrense]